MAILQDFEANFIEICDSHNRESDPSGQDFINEVKDQLIEILASTISLMGEFSFDRCSMSEYRSENQRQWLLLLFQKNEKALDWFLSFVVSNIRDWDLIVRRTHKYFGGKFEMDEIDFGARYYVAHYMTLALYSLFVSNNNNKNENWGTFK